MIHLYFLSLMALLVVGFNKTSYAVELPKLSIGGFLDIQGAHSHQNPRIPGEGGGIDRGDPTTMRRSFTLSNDTEIHIGIDGKSPLGFEYGARIELEADIAPYYDDGAANADRTWLFFDTPAGRLEFGSNIGASTAMKIDASSVARATGGIGGDWLLYADSDLDDVYPPVTPDLPLNSHKLRSPLHDDHSNKITYYTPILWGFQAGVSYILDSKVTGTAISFTQDELSYHDTIQAVLRYQYERDRLALALSLAGEHGTANDNYNSLNAWDLGGMLTYQNFSIAGSYGDWGKTGYYAPSFEARNDGRQYWTAGLGYVREKWGASVTYMQSWGEKDFRGISDRFDNVVLGTDYQLFPGLSAYAEWSLFDISQRYTVDRPSWQLYGNNHGNVLIVGTMLSF